MVPTVHINGSSLENLLSDLVAITDDALHDEFSSLALAIADQG
jgi:hypothetical protein